MKLWVVFILLLSVFFGGCTSSGVVVEESSNKTISCVDTRDGETFVYAAKDISDVRVGYFGAPTTFTIVDNYGNTRHLSSVSDAWLKCVTINEEIK